MTELGEAHAEDRVEIRKDNETGGLGVLTDFGGEFQNVLKPSSLLEGPLTGALDHGSIGDGVAEGDAELNDAGSGGDSGEDNFFGRSEIGVSAGDISDERGFAVEVEGHRQL